MRAQFATIEALMALTLALSTATAISQALGTYQHDYNSQYSNLSMAVAAHDFIQQMSSNATAQYCMDGYAQDHSGCMSNYTGYYMSVYGLSAIGVVEQSAGYNYSKVYCGAPGGYNLICIGVS